MLKINVRGENIEVTGSIREYVEKKLAKLEKYFEDTSSSTAHVNLKVYSDKNCKVEVTIPLPYLVLRAEETSPDMYASIDLVTDKLERRSESTRQSLTVSRAKRVSRHLSSSRRPILKKQPQKTKIRDCSYKECFVEADGCRGGNLANGHVGS